MNRDPLPLTCQNVNMEAAAAGCVSTVSVLKRLPVSFGGR